MNVIFFGTSEFGIPALEALKKADAAPVLIISTPDKPKGRKLQLSPSPIKEWAEKNGIETIAPAKLNNPEVSQTLQTKKPDLFVVASYGKVLPKEILDIPRKGTINIHPSLLPQFRGPSPIQTAILEDVETGVTLMLTDEEIDHGPILVSSKLKAQSSKPTYKDLEKELAELGARMLIETLPKWMVDEIIPQEQDHTHATFTKKISKEDGRINWQEPAEIIERKIRAFNPWPGTYAFWRRPQTNADETRTYAEKKQQKNLRVIITKATILKESVSHNTHPPGTVIKIKNGELAVAASDALLVIETLKPEGKNEMSGKDFLKGNSVTQFS
ncbi:MAG: methionyl-tRNA formyltransferase [bacterium]|nr:methionyl-tRNA formyltransferase [bacterium]